jgi:exopolyphosphatase / guanosine-5'-triphosphate,3'-diphosphate pyrophosphatase
MEGALMRVAAIDIGSNAVRFTAAERTAEGGLSRLDYQRAAVRLGHSAFVTGRLTEANLGAAVEAMVDFARRMDDLRVDRYRAVATSAVREAANGEDLVRRTREETGIEIDVIDGAEEARVVWVAVRDRIRLEGVWLLVDLGGGSLEVSTIRDGELEHSESYPLGTVRLLERLDEGGGGSDGGGSGDAVDAAVAEVEGEIGIPAGGVSGMLATGGNIEALAELAEAESDGAGVERLSLEMLSSVMARVEALPLERRISDLELRPDRADVIVPAGRIYRRVAELAGVDEIVVPGVGVSDGILLEA